nr:probable 26S proteasome non-ATPase regulatory subunit 3 [Tanacetum cinerariifolium]
LRLRFEQEAKLLKKSVAQVARREKRIQDRELEIKNLEVLLETEAEMKRAAEGKNAELMRELEDIRAQFSGLKVSNEHLSQRVAALQEQVSGEETAIAGRRWVIGHGLRLAMMKCVESLEMRQAFADVVSAGVAKGMNEGLKHGVEHGRSQLELKSLEAYDPEAEAKFVAALQSLKDLKFSLLDQLEGLKDAPMDVIMAALYLESDSGGDAPQYIRDLRPISSQLTILVYPEHNLFIFHASSIGDLELFKTIAHKFSIAFTSDRTNNLIVILRHNVIRIGLRNISIFYSRISLDDVAKKLRLDSPNPVADAESIVSKAIRDGAIDATLDHANGWMVSKETGDIYSTNEPQLAFNSRIAFCLNMHNEAVCALRFPPNSHKEIYVQINS